MNADMKWLDNPEVFKVNQLEPHSDHCYYLDHSDMKKEKNPLLQSLNGQWEFAYSKNVMERPVDFYKETFDASGFDKIMVPGHIELAGYDKIRYINTMYPWEGKEYHRGAYSMQATGAEEGMFSEAQYNPVGSYIKYFDLDKNMCGKRIHICFEGVEEAMYLTKFARKVTIIHRRNELRAAKSIQEKAFKNDKIEFMWDSVVEEVGGDDILQWMKVKNVKTGEVTTVEADEEDGMFGVFGFIGTIPNSKPFEGIIDMDERGYIKTDDDMHTNIPGVYAAGDVRIKSLRQVVTAAADGAIAAVQVERSMSDYF